MLIRCVVQVASGLATYHLILSPIWTLEISELHIGRSKATAVGSCVIPWAGDVGVAQSLIYEIVGTFLLEIGNRKFQSITVLSK